MGKAQGLCKAALDRAHLWADRWSQSRAAAGIGTLGLHLLCAALVGGLLVPGRSCWLEQAVDLIKVRVWTAVPCKYGLYLQSRVCFGEGW